MLKVRVPQEQRLILNDVSWQKYTRLLHVFSDQHLRLTFDRGTLEIMTLSPEHEGLAEFLNWMVLILVEELKVSIKLGGSTTFRKRRKLKGLEPDKCYWIAHAAVMRGKKTIDLRVDPPPDLTIEVDITHSSLNRMRIYASLKVPAVWRFDANGLAFLGLSADGDYLPVALSTTFPLPLAAADLLPFIHMRDTMDDDVVIRKFREWIRGRIQANSNPS